MQHALAAIQVLDELGDAAVVLELRLLGLARLGIGGALVGQRDQQSLVQESELAQALRQGVVVVLGSGEDLFVRNKADFGAALLRGSGFLQLGSRLTLRIGLLPHRTVAPDFQLQQMTQRVDAGDADAMESARNFVGRAVEFSARVQHGHHDLSCGQTLAINIHLTNRNAAAIVHDRDGVIDVNGYVDAISESGQGLIDGVVDNFVDKVMQSHLASRSDIHCRTLAHGFHPAEDLDGFSSVVPVGMAVLAILLGSFFVHGRERLVSL